MDTLLLELLEEMEKIGKQHEELFDTYVRHEMRGAIHDGFLQPKEQYQLPHSFGMCSPETDALIRTVLKRFIDAANAKALELGLTFHERLSSFQNDDVRTEQEGNDYDEFFGHIPPGLFDSDGNYLG